LLGFIDDNADYGWPSRGRHLAMYGVVCLMIALHTMVTFISHDQAVGLLSSSRTCSAWATV